MTPKQKIFCDEYLISLNATEAAIKAGYSAKTAAVIATENLTKPYIKEYIENRLKERENRTEITQDRVLKEIARIAFLDPRKFFDENGNLKNITDLDDDTAAALGGFDVSLFKSGSKEKTETEIIKKIKQIDKKGALELLARHLGMLNDKLQLNGKLSFDKLITQDGLQEAINEEKRIEPEE